MTPTLAVFLTVGVCVIAAILVLVLILLIPLLLQIRRTAQEAEKLIDSIRIQVAPVSRDIGLISRDIKSIVQSIHRQIERAEDGIEAAHDMVTRVKDFEIEVQRRLEGPLFALATVLGTIKRGAERIVGIFGQARD